MARTDYPERLDGAILRETALDSRFSLSHCVINEGDFRQGKFRGTDFSQADLEKGNFNKATLSGANFEGAYLGGAKFKEAILGNANLRESTIDEGNFKNADLGSADLTRASIPVADFHEANLKGADLRETALDGANLRNVILRRANVCGADFSDTDLNSADIRHANLSEVDVRDADLTDVNAREANFDESNLENTILTRTDLREADLPNADLYQTQFSDTRINSQTTFDDDGAKCSYEADDEPPEIAEDVPPLQAATWVYRRLEALHEENALADRTRQFHIRKEEAQRKLDRRQGNHGRYLVATMNHYLTNHGESIKRLLVAWAVTILGAGLLYPFVGGVEDGDALYQIHPVLELPTLAGIVGALDALLRGIYFSIITFTTIGYANVAPHGPGSRVLVGIESLVGAILIALFVYVLGRRVAR